MKQFLGKSIIFLLFISLLMLQNVQSVIAASDPRAVANNKYGIHIVDPNDLEGVTELINSQNTQWGYVKVVIPETDRNTGKWDSVFRELRRRKLIPIVRIATQSKGPVWIKPTQESLNDWPSFLNSLSWPVQNRYVILFNEPNHAQEWGGEINPEEFGAVTVSLAKKLKEASPDYFILPAGLDVSAANTPNTMDAEQFLRKTVSTNPEFLSVLDGWNSHSYPNPAFSALPTKQGRGSLWSFDWELSLIKSLGESRDLPVLIGETGWIHSDGEFKNLNYLNPQNVAQFYKIAGETVWNDPRIFAVTPFVYNYQGEPFAHFSFRKFGEQGYHPHYFAYQTLKRISGRPLQREVYELLSDLLPKKLVAGSSYTFPLEITNKGQAILTPDDGYEFSYEEPSNTFRFITNVVPKLEPDQKGTTYVNITTPNMPGEYTISLSIKQQDKRIYLASSIVNVLPPPTLTLTAQLGWQRTSEASSASVLIYDGDEVIYEFTDLPVRDGFITTPGVLGIIPDRSYRIVTLVPYYLPRQTIQQINEQVTFVENKRFYPFDTDNNGALEIKDIVSLLQSPPASILPRFFSN